MLAKEAEQRLVATLVFGFDPIVAEVRAGSHPAVNLVVESLHVLGDLEGLLKLLDVLGGLVAGSQHYERNVDAVGVGGVDHGRVNRGSGIEDVGAALGGQRNSLATPAVLCFIKLAGSFLRIFPIETGGGQK